MQNQAKSNNQIFDEPTRSGQTQAQSINQVASSSQQPEQLSEPALKVEQKNDLDAGKGSKRRSLVATVKAAEYGSSKRQCSSKLSSLKGSAEAALDNSADLNSSNSSDVLLGPKTTAQANVAVEADTSSPMKAGASVAADPEADVHPATVSDTCTDTNSKSKALAASPAPESLENEGSPAAIPGMPSSPRADITADRTSDANSDHVVGTAPHADAAAIEPRLEPASGLQSQAVSTISLPPSDYRQLKAEFAEASKSAVTADTSSAVAHIGADVVHDSHVSAASKHTSSADLRDVAVGQDKLVSHNADASANASSEAPDAIAEAAAPSATIPVTAADNAAILESGTLPSTAAAASSAVPASDPTAVSSTDPLPDAAALTVAAVAPTAAPAVGPTAADVPSAVAPAAADIAPAVAPTAATVAPAMASNASATSEVAAPAATTAERDPTVPPTVVAASAVAAPSATAPATTARADALAPSTSASVPAPAVTAVNKAASVAVKLPATSGSTRIGLPSRPGSLGSSILAASKPSFGSTRIGPALSKGLLQSALPSRAASSERQSPAPDANAGEPLSALLLQCKLGT